MNSNDTIRLLIINDSRAEAERLISMLQNAGRPSRAQHVESEEALVKLLQEQTWDLLVAHDAAEQLPAITAIRQIRRLSKDIAVILQTDEPSSQSSVEGIKQGAKDVVGMDEDQHLLLVINRELDNTENRRQCRSADRKRIEAERRSQELLDSSRDAIAYVQDGLFLYANESFAEAFGYTDKDDIDCMPVIDMVAPSDHGTIKSFLKDFTLKGEEMEASELDFNGIAMDDSEIPLKMEVSSAIFDEEVCIEFLMRANTAANAELEEQIQQIKHQDLVTGLFNRQYLMEQLQATVANMEEGQQTGSLLHISVDNYFSRIQPELGVSGADIVLSELAAISREFCRGSDVLARFGDDAFMMLIGGINADEAVSRGEALCKKIEAHIIQVDDKSLQVTASIGVSLINETLSNSEAAIDQALRAGDSLREGNDGIGNGCKLFEPILSEEEAAEKDIVSQVQKALDDDRFRLLFQPVISLRGEDIEHYEVLLRMINADDEEVSPNEFIEQATQIGASTKIDRWVILNSIKMLGEHRANGHKTRLLLNLTRQSMCDGSLLPWLSVAFKAANLPTDAIIFQVNETDVTNHMNDAKRFTKGLNEMHSLSSISRFGCSLNPFNTLKHIEADYIKVDGSFVQDIQKQKEDPETLIGLIKELHQQDKITVVPFVENASVLSTLWQAGAHYIQGHYLQGPAGSMNYDFSNDE